MMEFLSTVSSWVSPYLTEVSVTVVATLLVIYGDVINKHIKRALAPYHFVIRTGVFVLICAFGYGALLLFVAPHFQALLSYIPKPYLGVSVIGVFLLLGYLAENRRYI